MDFNIPLILVGLGFSSVGFVYFSYGKRMANTQLIATGVGLMVYPYITNTMTSTVITGIVLSALPFVMRWW